MSTIVYNYIRYKKHYRLVVHYIKEEDGGVAPTVKPITPYQGRGSVLDVLK